MKKLLSVFLLAFIHFCFSQNYTANYELAYKRDSTNRADVRKENFLLMISGGHSVFESEAKYVADSALAKIKDAPANESNFAVAMAMMAKLPRTSFQEIIYKDYAENQLTFYGTVVTSKISYVEKPDFQWQILPDKKKIGTLDCQKAFTKYFGRNFTAWFAQSVPFQDGPYKFSGLPGLIVEIYDDRDDYHYTLLDFKNKKTAEQDLPKSVQTTKAKYYAAYNDFLANPEAAMMRDFASQGVTITKTSGAPNKVNDRWKKRNNPLELKPL